MAACFSNSAQVMSTHSDAEAAERHPLVELLDGT